MECPWCKEEVPVEEFEKHLTSCPGYLPGIKHSESQMEESPCSLIFGITKELLGEMKHEYSIFTAALAPSNRPAYNIFVFSERLQGVLSVAKKLNCPNLAEIEKLIAESMFYAMQIRPPIEISPKPTIIFRPTIEEKYAGFRDLDDPILLAQIKNKLADWGKQYWEAARTRGKVYSSKELLDIVDAFGKLNVSLAFGLPNEVFDLFVERCDKIFPEYVLGIKKRKKVEIW